MAKTLADEIRTVLVERRQGATAAEIASEIGQTAELVEAECDRLVGADELRRDWVGTAKGLAFETGQGVWVYRRA